MSNELVPSDNPEEQPQPPAETPAERLLFTPLIDIYETEDGLVLLADLPGVTTDSLELQVQDNKLTLFGRVENYVPDGSVAHHEEYGIGDFLRSFILTHEVDHQRISAKLNNGVLKVVLPRSGGSEPHKISIDTGE